MQPVITESKVREIAKEEAIKIQKEILKEIEVLSKIASVNSNSISDNTDILKRLERLLLGELGTDEDDTLKARANFAYRYTKRNTDLQIVEKAIPALDWFNDMSCVEKGAKESKLDTLGKVITFYSNIRWILGIIGITTLINAIPIIQGIIVWIEKLST